MGLLIHSVLIVFESEFFQHAQLSILLCQHYRWVRYSIKHVAFHRGVMKHVLKDDILADCQVVVKLPISHEVAAKA